MQSNLTDQQKMILNTAMEQLWYELERIVDRNSTAPHYRLHECLNSMRSLYEIMGLAGM